MRENIYCTKMSTFNVYGGGKPLVYGMHPRGAFLELTGYMYIYFADKMGIYKDDKQYY